jgi:hypothetical protein
MRVVRSGCCAEARRLIGKRQASTPKKQIRTLPRSKLISLNEAEKTGNQPQFTTNPEDLLYPQQIGPSTTIDFALAKVNP